MVASESGVPRSQTPKSLVRNTPTFLMDGENGMVASESGVPRSQTPTTVVPPHTPTSLLLVLVPEIALTLCLPETSYS